MTLTDIHQDTEVKPRATVALSRRELGYVLTKAAMFTGDSARPILQHAELRLEADAVVVTVTDAYRLVYRRIKTADGANASNVGTSGLVSLERGTFFDVVKTWAKDRHGTQFVAVDFYDDEIRVCDIETEAVYRHRSPGDFPNYQTLEPTGEPTGLDGSAIGLNPKFVADWAKLSKNNPVRLTFDGPMKPCRFKITDDLSGEWYGLLMPVRLT